jgi:RHH-type rel operon transcriptional repressor/antitoxin RelB
MESKMLSIRLPEDLENKLNFLSDKTQRPKSFYIKEALERYMEDMEDTFIALDRISKPNRKLLNSEELLSKLKNRK